MAGGLRLSPWLGAGALLGAGAAIAGLVPSARLDWQPGLALAEPWRAWTAAFVHWSPLHLGANALGLALVVLLGGRAGCRGPATVAWLAAWPLTHWWLLWQPGLAHYGGLSGVLHAGVAVACCQLLQDGPARRRLVGALLLAGLLAKVLLEEPWRGPLRSTPGWDIAIAPLAHATGAGAGLLCGALAWRWSRRRRRPLRPA